MVDVRSVQEIEIDRFTVAVGENASGEYEASLVERGRYTLSDQPVVTAKGKYSAVGKAIDAYLEDDDDRTHN